MVNTTKWWAVSIGFHALFINFAALLTVVIDGTEDERDFVVAVTERKTVLSGSSGLFVPAMGKEVELATEAPIRAEQIKDDWGCPILPIELIDFGPAFDPDTWQETADLRAISFDVPGDSAEFEDIECDCRKCPCSCGPFWHCWCVTCRH